MPYQSRSLADLILAEGQARAQAAQQSGQAWGQAVQNIGQIASRSLGDYLQYKQEAPKRALEAAQLKTVTDQQAQLERQRQGQTALADAIKRFSDPTTGTVDYQKVASAVSQQFPDIAQSWLKVSSDNAENLSKLTESTRKHQQDQLAALGDLAYSAKTPQDFTAAVGLAATHGLLDEQTAHEIAANAATDQWQAIRDKYLQFSPKAQAAQAKAKEPFNLNPGEVRFNGDGTQLASVPTKPPNSQEAEFLLDGKRVKGDYLPGVNGQGGKYLFQGQDVTGRAQGIPPAAAAGSSDDDVKLAVQGMRAGTLPPQLPGRATKEYVAMMAEAQRQGYDLATAATDWTATQKHIATLNGSQQLRLNQSVNALPELLDSVESLAKQWKGGKFPILNKANLALAKNGAYGDKAATIAAQLDAQIADVTADLGNVYMGGNSPTDHALDLASKSLKGEWSEPVLLNMVGLARKNVQIRKNSIANTGVQGASADNPYMPPAPRATVKMKAPNGQTQDVSADQVEHYKSLGAVVVP